MGVVVSASFFVEIVGVSGRFRDHDATDRQPDPMRLSASNDGIMKWTFREALPHGRGLIAVCASVKPREAPIFHVLLLNAQNRQQGYHSMTVEHMRRVNGLAPAALAFALAIATAPARSESGTCAAAAGAVKQDCLLAEAMPRPGDGSLPRDDLGAPVEAPLSDDAFRPVTGAELVANPGAVLRRPVAVAAARCFSFGVGDYRCVVEGAVPVAVATAIVIPPGAEVAVERGCDADEPSGCSCRILFVPTSFRRAQLSGTGAVLFRTPNVIVAPADAGRPTREVKP